MKLLFACLFVGTVYAAPGTHYCQQLCVKADGTHFSIQCNCNNKGAAVGSCNCGAGATPSGEPSIAYGDYSNDVENISQPAKVETPTKVLNKR